MNNDLSPSNPGQLSLSKAIQSRAIRWDQNYTTKTGKLGLRTVVVIVKTPALFVDIGVNVFVGLAKITLHPLLLTPINFVARNLDKKEILKNWTIKQGLFHFGFAGLYAFDIIANPIVNLSSPDYYVSCHLPSYSHAFVDPNTQDRKGNTPLMLATYRNDNKTITRLLKAGAKTDIINEVGETPYIQMKYEYNRKHTTAFNHVKASSYDRQWKHLKTLGHIASIPGEFKLNNHKISFEGMFKGKPFSTRIFKDLHLFTEKFAHLIPISTKKILNKAIEPHTRSSEVSTQELAKRYRKGEPIIIQSGHVGHFISVVLWENKFIICNRNPGNWSPINTMKVPDNIENFIDNIKNLRKAKKIKHNKFFDKLRKNGTIETEKSPLTEGHFILSNQTVGNCGYANLESAIYSIWQLAALKEDLKVDSLNKIKTADPEKIKQSLKRTSSLFHEFRAYQTEKLQAKVEETGWEIPEEILVHVSKSLAQDKNRIGELPHPLL